MMVQTNNIKLGAQFIAGLLNVLLRAQHLPVGRAAMGRREVPRCATRAAAAAVQHMRRLRCQPPQMQVLLSLPSCSPSLTALAGPAHHHALIDVMHLKRLCAAYGLDYNSHLRHCSLLQAARGLSAARAGPCLGCVQR